MVVKGPGRPAAQHKGVEGRIGEAAPQSEPEARADRRMRLETLKLLERVQERVVIVEPDHKPDRDLAIFEVVQKRAAIGAAVEWPADGVDDESGLVALRRNLP